MNDYIRRRFIVHYAEDILFSDAERMDLVKTKIIEAKTTTEAVRKFFELEEIAEFMEEHDGAEIDVGKVTRMKRKGGER